MNIIGIVRFFFTFIDLGDYNLNTSGIDIFGYGLYLRGNHCRSCE